MHPFLDIHTLLGTVPIGHEIGGWGVCGNSERKKRISQSKKKSVLVKNFVGTAHVDHEIRGGCVGTKKKNGSV